MGIDLSRVTDRDTRALLRGLRANGQLDRVVAHASGHLLVQLANGSAVTVPRTPSDRRNLANIKAQLRRQGVPVPYGKGVSMSQTQNADGWPTRLREARNAEGLSQQALASLVGYSGAAVHHWEVGRFNPPPDVKARLDDLLHITDEPEVVPVQEQADEPTPEPTADWAQARAQALDDAQGGPVVVLAEEAEKPEPADRDWRQVVAEKVMAAVEQHLQTTLRVELQLAYDRGYSTAEADLEAAQHDLEQAVHERNEAVALRELVVESMDRLRALAQPLAPAPTDEP